MSGTDAVSFRRAKLIGQGAHGKATRPFPCAPLDCRAGKPSLAPMSPVLRSSGNLAPDRRYDYARGAASDGDHAAAADLCEQALELAPDWAAAWFALGEARGALGAVEAAQEAFARALACDHADSQGAGL